jgi:argininosuccinate lyase
MPQKRNSDTAELIRGKSGRFIGNLTGFLATIKALPFAYNRDLQEDKEPIFDSVEQLQSMLNAMNGMIKELRFIPENITKNATADFALATEIADYLVTKQVPFAKAHHISGEIVAYCEKAGKTLESLSLAEFQKFSTEIEVELLASLNPQSAVNSRNSVMGTNPDSVAKAIAANQIEISELHRKFSDQLKALSGKLSW